MTWVATAVIGSAVIGAATSRSAAKTQASAAKDAGQYQLTAARETIQEQRRQFDIAQRNAQPWMDAGTRSLSRMEEMLYGPPRPQQQQQQPQPQQPYINTQAALPPALRGPVGNRQWIRNRNFGNSSFGRP